MRALILAFVLILIALTSSSMAADATTHQAFNEGEIDARESELFTGQTSFDCNNGTILKFPPFWPKPQISHQLIPNNDGYARYIIAPQSSCQSNSDYKVYFGLGADCTGAHVCTEGSFTSVRIIRGLITDILFLFENELYERLQKVELHRNTEAFIIPARCAAYCGETKLVWSDTAQERDKRYYIIGSKYPNTEAMLINAANSFIDQQ